MNTNLDVDLYEVKAFLENFPESFTNKLSIIDTEDIGHPLYFVKEYESDYINYSIKDRNPFAYAGVYSTILGALNSINTTEAIALGEPNSYFIYCIDFRKALRPDKSLLTDDCNPDELWLIDYSEICSVYKPILIGNASVQSVSYEKASSILPQEIVTYRVDLKDGSFLTKADYLLRDVWDITVKNKSLLYYRQKSQINGKLPTSQPSVLSDLLQRGSRFFRW